MFQTGAYMIHDLQKKQRNLAINVEDDFYLSSYRNVLVPTQLHVPGLQMFGKHTITSALPPLLYHYHKNCFEFTYVSKGTITFSVDDIDYKLTGGDTFITRPDQTHSSNFSPISVSELYWFRIDAATCKSILHLDEEASLSILSSLHQIPNPLIKTDQKEMLSYIKKSFSIFMNQQSPYMAASYLAIFLHRLLDYSKKTQFSLSPDIDASIHYILTHLTEELLLDELAKLCNLSTSQYKQKFKSQMGISPRHYINFQKIERSKTMLQEGMGITEIAMKLGFNTSSYFSVVFKRYNADCPSVYLQKNIMKGSIM